MKLRSLTAAAALSVAGLWNGFAHATILTFDIVDPSRSVHSNGLPEGFGYAMIAQPYAPLSGYGNNVLGTGPFDHGNGTTTFNYGQGLEGITPNVTTQIGPHGVVTGGPILWKESYGSLVNMVIQGGDSPYLEVMLSGDAWHDVQLYGFDLGTDDLDPNFKVKNVSVFRGVPNALFTPTNQIFQQNDVLFPSGDVSFDFDDPLAGIYPLQANVIFIRVDMEGHYRDYPVLDEFGNQVLDEFGNPKFQRIHDRVGIDNIRFGQVERLTPVPEPASLALFGMGLGSLGLIRFRNRRTRESH